MTKIMGLQYRDNGDMLIHILNILTNKYNFKKYIR